MTKPVVGYVAGFTAPEGKTMGHAGAIVSGSSGTAAAKQEALEAAGVKVGKTPSETAELMREIMTRSASSPRPELDPALTLPSLALSSDSRRRIGAGPACSDAQVIWVTRSPARTAMVSHCSSVKSKSSFGFAKV